MVKYFINYEDLYENNVINKNITLYSSCLFIKRKYKKGLVKFEPILYLNDNNHNVLNYARKLNYNKKGILMVELSLEEANKFDELLIKKYEQVNDNVYKKIFENKEDISLIGFKSLINMNEEELSRGNVVVLMPCISDKDYMYISADRGKLSREYNVVDRRNMLLKESIGSDIYFHTNDNDLKDLYINDTTSIKEVDFCKYQIVNHKLFVLDSINPYDIIGFNDDNYYCLDVLSKNATPIYIQYIGDNYKLSISEKIDYNKKGYIINTLYFDNFISSDAIKPLIKFINVYELVDGVYKKESLEKYLNDIKVLKYVKKNW